MARHRLRRELWTPRPVALQVPNCQLWLDASDLTVADGSNVSFWRDKSGNQRHATQSTTASQPVVKQGTNGINNRTTVRFNGSSTRLNTPSFTVNQPDTMFVVTRIAVAGLGIFLNGITTRQQLWSDSSNHCNMYAGTVNTSSAGPLGVGISTISSAIFNGGVSSAYYINGTVEIAGGNPGASAISGGLMLGTDGSSFLNGDIAEIIIYSQALDTHQHNAIGQYLAAKYGLTWTNL